MKQKNLLWTLTANIEGSKAEKTIIRYSIDFDDTMMCK